MNTTHISIKDNLDDLYKDVIKEVMSEDNIIEARGLRFKEIIFPHLVLTNPRARIIQNSARKISKKFMIAEFIWMMGGRSDIEMLSHYNKNISQFSDDGRTLHGAYGPRLRYWEHLHNGEVRYMDQLESCVQRLKQDTGSRQAVMIILNPGNDLMEKTKDVPCNDLLQFFIRDNKLHMSCYVRSNDVNWGFPYDIFHWTMLQELYAGILGVELGEYHHIAGSLHIYDKDFELMEKILSENVVHTPMPYMPRYKDLEILQTLGQIETQIRSNGSSLLKIYDPYWTPLLEYLKK